MSISHISMNEWEKYPKNELHFNKLSFLVFTESKFFYMPLLKKLNLKEQQQKKNLKTVVLKCV